MSSSSSLEIAAADLLTVVMEFDGGDGDDNDDDAAETAIFE